jgi:xylulose-5-phosphate/fructose-6-phosphate phosphoketolase
MHDPLTPDVLQKMHAYWRAANYLSVGQIYLQDNPLLETPLKLEHVKPRLLGHWGTTTGLNFLYVHLNRLIKNNDLNIIYVVGDGEAETGALATSWHSNKFLNPARDGAVLPILHLNGFKIANPTVLARISRQELTDLLRGYGYDPHFVEDDDPALVHQNLAGTLDRILAEIRRIQNTARSAGKVERLVRPRWPMIVFRTPKGWTGPKFVDGKPVEGTWRAHQVPIVDFKKPEHLKQLEDWMRSYRPQELFDEHGKFREEFAALAPTGNRRMGSNPHANGGELLQPPCGLARERIRMPLFPVRPGSTGFVFGSACRI